MNVKATASVSHGLSEVVFVVSEAIACYFNRFGRDSVINSDQSWSVVVRDR
jgi:hypothetical protein